jgi:hypothetical protein
MHVELRWTLFGSDDGSGISQERPTLQAAYATERVAAEPAQFLAFGIMTRTEALMTAQVRFHSYPGCSRRGMALKQWRKPWAFDWQICGTRLLSILIKPDRSRISEKLVRRA